MLLIDSYVKRPNKSKSSDHHKPISRRCDQATSSGFRDDAAVDTGHGKHINFSLCRFICPQCCIIALND